MENQFSLFKPWGADYARHTTPDSKCYLHLCQVSKYTGQSMMSTPPGPPGSGITGQVLRNRVEGDGWILRVSNCPPRFWQFSKPYLNQRGQIVPPTLIFAHSALGSFLRP